MTITSARYSSHDNYRIEYVEDGETKRTKRNRPEYDVVLAVIPNPDAYVYPALKYENKESKIMHAFWGRVAASYGVTIERAKAHVAVNGANATVTALYDKAVLLLDDTSVSLPDIKDEGKW